MQRLAEGRRAEVCWGEQLWGEQTADCVSAGHASTSPRFSASSASSCRSFAASSSTAVILADQFAADGIPLINHRVHVHSLPW